MDMSVFLPSEKFLGIQKLAHYLLQRQSVTVHHIMPFLGKIIFCANGHVELCHFFVSFRVILMTVYYSPAHLFFSPFSRGMVSAWRYLAS